MHIEPAIIVNTSFQIPSRKRDLVVNNSSQIVEPSKAPRTTKAHRVLEELQFFDQLHKVQPSCIIFYSLSPLVRESAPSQVIRK